MTPLKFHRMQARITQEDLAQAVGVNKSTICRIETGGPDGRFRTTPDVADAIQKFFNGKVTRDQILFPQDYKPDGTPIERKPKARKGNSSRVS